MPPGDDWPDDGQRRPLTASEREVLRDGLAPVLRDLEATGAILPSFRKDRYEPVGGDFDGVYLWGADGTGMGLVVPSAGTAAGRVASLADGVQEWEIEELAAARPATWPECPDHPDSHPLEPVVNRGNVAVWRCPRTGRVIGEIGTLGTRR